jgi:hypothetical protein
VVSVSVVKFFGIGCGSRVRQDIWALYALLALFRPAKKAFVSALAGKTVKLRFVMRDARLYAFQFVPAKEEA